MSKDLSDRRMENGFQALIVLFVVVLLAKGADMAVGIVTALEIVGMIIGGTIAAVIAVVVVVYVLGYLTTDVPMHVRRWLG